jgi:hypothetical protein
MPTSIKLSYPLYERSGEKYLTKLMDGIADEQTYTLSFTLHSDAYYYKTMPNLTGVEVKAEIQRRIRNYDGVQE